MVVRLLLLSLSTVSLAAPGPSRAAERAEAGTVAFSAQAAATFRGRCTACHTYGKGVKVGPDLMGVTERRSRRWLVQFIHGSSAMIASGDRTAVALFSEFKQQRMPDWTELSEKQIEDILDYLAAGGPDRKPADERNAETATTAEVDLGRRLFDGAVRLQDGGQPCSSCHAARGSGWALGGSLGPDLSAVYPRYEDRALTTFLRQPCFRWDASIGGERRLTPAESFALKAFLRRSSLPQAVATAAAPTPAEPYEATREGALTEARPSKGTTALDGQGVNGSSP